MSHDFYLGCAECRRKIHLGSQGPLTARLAVPSDEAEPILDFIIKHQGCDGGVVAGDDSRDWKEDDVSDWPTDQGEPTMAAVRHAAAILAGYADTGPKLEDHLKAQGLPVPTAKEKAAIFEASGKANADPQSVREALHKTADILAPFRDPNLEPLVRPQEPR